MNPLNIIIVLSFTALVFLFWHILISEKIIKYLNSNDFSERTFFRITKMPKYVYEYKNLSLKNEGKIGEHFQTYFLTAITFIALLIATILSFFLINLN